MRLNGGSKGIPSDILGQIRTRGAPLVARVDKILGDSTLVVSPLVPALGKKANEPITIRMAPSKARTRTIAEAIAGTEKTAKIVPADIIAFDNAFEFEGEVLVDQISARTSDTMRGQVQVITAMARPSKSRVNAKGALQSLTIADGKHGYAATSTDKVREMFEWVKAQPWPGGTPGLLIRDADGYATEFFEEGRKTINTLIEDMEHEDVFANSDAVIELVPLWRLPMGRDQVIKDVDPRQETAEQAGPFTRKFISPETRNYPGFLACLVILADEEQWEFGGKTGKVIRVAAGVQPLYKDSPKPRERLPSRVRTCKGTVNTVNTLYDRETLEAMMKEREDRCPRPAAQPAARAVHRDDEDVGGPQVQRRPNGRFSLNSGGLSARPKVSDTASAPAPAPTSGPRRFGR